MCYHLSRKRFFRLNGTAVRFTTRRQGSIHLLTNSSNRPVLRQLDSWHEPAHFLRWSSALALEAELHDDHVSVSAGHALEPLTQLAQDAAHSHDFAGSITFVTLAAGSQLRFSVTPRPAHTAPGRVCHAASRFYSVTARARFGASGDVASSLVASTEGLHRHSVTVTVGSGPDFSDWYIYVPWPLLRAD